MQHRAPCTQPSQAQIQPIFHQMEVSHRELPGFVYLACLRMLFKHFTRLLLKVVLELLSLLEMD